MKLRVYLDTSVFSAIYDSRHTDRKVETERFWEKLQAFEVSSSGIAKMEISQTLNSELRSKMLQLLNQVTMISVTQEMNGLAQGYLDAHIFPQPCVTMHCMLQQPS